MMNHGFFEGAVSGAWTRLDLHDWFLTYFHPIEILKIHVSKCPHIILCGLLFREESASHCWRGTNQKPRVVVLSTLWL